VEGAVPEKAESANQDWSVTPEKRSVPLPAFVMLKPAGVSWELPTCPVKFKFAGFTASTAVVAVVVVVVVVVGFTVKAIVALLLESAWLVAVTLT
jgi:hypothetical protein